MRLGIVGSRDFKNEELVKSSIRTILEEHPEIHIVSGGARGVDQWAESVYNEITGKAATVFQVDTFQGMNKWDFRVAAFKRNKKIVKGSDAVIAFWTEDSTGTANTVTYSLLKKVPVKVFDKDSAEAEVVKSVRVLRTIVEAKK